VSRQIAFGAVLAGVMAALLIVAAPGRAGDRDRIRAFLDVTGFDVALDSIALTAPDAPGMLGMEPGDFGRDWTRISDEVFDSATMRAMAMDMLAPTLSDDMLGHAAGFYASDLGQRLVAAENAAHMEENGAAAEDEGAALLSAASPERVETLRRLTEAVDGSGFAVKAVQEVMVRFTMAASRAGMLESRVDEQGLRALLAAREDAMRADMKRAAMVNSARTYRDFGTGDLAAYAAALEHPVMQRVYELMNAVQFEITANRLEVLAACLAELPPEQEL